MARPAAELRPYVEAYTGYRMEGFAPGLHRGLPGRHLTFIVSLGPPVDLLAMPDPKHPARQLQAFVSGYDFRWPRSRPRRQAARPGARRHTTWSSPAARPAGGELAGICVSLDEVLGAVGERAVCATARGLGLDAALRVAGRGAARACRQRRIGDPRPEVVAAWDQIVATGGARSRWAALAAELGWSRRHLASAFRAELGLFAQGRRPCRCASSVLGGFSCDRSGRR